MSILIFPERQPSPQLNINLSSNNPFRNRAVSPSATSPNSTGRPVSTNPFLDETDLTSFQSAPSASMSSTSKPSLMGNTAELFVCLSFIPTRVGNHSLLTFLARRTSLSSPLLRPAIAGRRPLAQATSLQAARRRTARKLATRTAILLMSLQTRHRRLQSLIAPNPMT